MPILPVRIPQIGEGLQEARLVAVLKQPGDKVRRDEPIYQMETDKAVMDVESPYEGTLVEWLAPTDSVLAIGAEVARMEVAEGVEEAGGHGHGPASPEASTAEAGTVTVSPSQVSTPANPRALAAIPPRTRAYAKEKGLSDDDLAALASSGAKLMPADVDAYLASQEGGKSSGRGGAYDEAPMAPKQRVLASRLQRGSQLVVSGTMSVAMNWGPIEERRLALKNSGAAFQPSAFTMWAYAVARALRDHPLFRSTLVGDGTLRTYRTASLGVAVARPGDELVLAVVEDADQLEWRAFADALRERIEAARNGEDQAHEGVTISLTNMQAFGLRDAVPVVVPPAVATLFLGEPYNGLSNDEIGSLKVRRCANLALTFDHRIMNGVGAANFLNDVRKHAESLEEWIGG